MHETATELTASRSTEGQDVTKSSRERDWCMIVFQVVMVAFIAAILVFTVVGGITSSRSEDRMRAAVRTEVLARYPQASSIEVAAGPYSGDPTVKFATPRAVCTGEYVQAGAHVALRHVRCLRSSR